MRKIRALQQLYYIMLFLGTDPFPFRNDKLSNDHKQSNDYFHGSNSECNIIVCLHIRCQG